MGKICPARGLRRRQLSPGKRLDQWEFWLGELIPPFLAFYVRGVKEPGCNPGAVAGAEERLRAVRGYRLRVPEQRESACPWSSFPPRQQIGQDGGNWEQRASQWGRVLLSTGLFWLLSEGFG